MTEPGGTPPLSTPVVHGPVRLCASDELVEKGDGVSFDVVEYGRPMRAFALRVDGAVVAYLNRCVHVGVELDWLPNHFLDDERRFILCAVHGAAYRPHDGSCAGGPCSGRKLTAIETYEQDGEVWWKPTRDIAPAPASSSGDQGSPSQ